MTREGLQAIEALIKSECPTLTEITVMQLVCEVATLFREKQRKVEAAGRGLLPCGY